EDIKSISRMGFFETGVAARKIPLPDGRVLLVYVVKERPQVTDVKLEGMKAIRTTDDKVIAAVKVHPGSILDPNQVKETINDLTGVYEEKSYLDVKIVFREVLQPDNTETAVFSVTEGPQVEIRKIEFHGNKAFNTFQLRNIMETSTYNWIYSWVTGAGALDRKKLQDDRDRLTAYYYDNGYLNAQIAEPKIERVGDSMTINITIDEGPVYKVGKIALGGNLKFPHHEVARLITLKRGERFRGSDLHHNELVLSDFYLNRGYAYVNVDPRTRLDQARRIIDVVFYINPGREVLVNRINISGNTKTSDKVIRRELQIQEQEPFSAEAIRESKTRLDRLGFFTDTRLTTAPATQPDKINLDVAVSEANTATLQVAGGFDSFQSLFGNFTLGNTNLFGGGESLILNAQIGFLFQNYSVTYNEPWFLDIPLSVALSLFDNKTVLLSFDQAAAGFQINSTYPLTELGFKTLGPISLKDTVVGLGYQFQSVGITNLPANTTYQILRYKGYTQTSELLPSFRRFTVDNPTDPRTGSILSFNGEIGGLGGGNSFLKGVLHGRYFYPFIRSETFGTFVVSQGVTFGIGTNLSSGSAGELPLYERFFPGGVGGGADVRGYQLYSLGPQVTIYNAAGQPISVQDIGGSKELLLSNEITFPILTGLGLRGVIFADAGQSFRLSDSMDPTKLQASYGIGIRWKSPFGPLAVDLARPINPRPSDLSTVFEIGAGAPL
ncbi:MAG TPA: outer membrane protein assembly factor BamA, partial [Candidatus Binataceae bacterium]|nr:outer membrane protein assembly factor BamA [Candidatus Binataceae bacterium]